jgi:hypothetical protein
LTRREAEGRVAQWASESERGNVAATVHMMSMVKTKARKNIVNLFLSDRLAHNLFECGHAVFNLD